MEWQTRTGTKRKGRQRRRWRDDLRSYAETVRTRTARNRDEWNDNQEQGKEEEVDKEEDGGMTLRSYAETVLRT